MGRVQLKRVSINDEAYVKILDSTSFKEKVPSIRPYACGYSDRHMIRYTDDALVCKLNFLVYAGVLDESYLNEDRGWYQVLCVKDSFQTKVAFQVTNPYNGAKRIESIIKEYYTDEEIEEIYHTHEDEDSTIIHVGTLSVPGKVIRFDNCYYYDANGAYASQTMKLFPRAEVSLNYKFIHRHDNNNEGKNDFNFFVGCLTQNQRKRAEAIKEGRKVRDIHPKTRHWIVNRVSEMLLDIERKLEPERIIYANTDGIIVQNPKNVLPSETAAGTFKVEYQGPIYTYQGRNYTLIQLGDEVKIIEDSFIGSCPICLRDRIDLSIGRVVKYTRKEADGYYHYTDVEDEIVEVCNDITGFKE